jgi:hypothetical protein
LQRILFGSRSPPPRLPPQTFNISYKQHDYNLQWIYNSEGISESTLDLPLARSQSFVVNNDSEEQPKEHLVLLPAHTLTSNQGVYDVLQYIKHCIGMLVAIPTTFQQVV